MVSLPKGSREEGVCPICLERLKEAVSTDCKHLFCRVCLAHHVEKASASGALCCPLCREPCSEEVLGEGYICPHHQKKVCRFCEETGSLLCVDCLELPEHQSHPKPTIEHAISHYKERLNRRSRKLRKDLGELQRLKAQEEEKLQALQVDLAYHKLEAELESQCQTKGQLDVLHPPPQDQPENMPEEAARYRYLSKVVIQLANLVTNLEKMAKELDATTLKNVSDLLNRSAPQKLDGLLSLLSSTGSAPH
ncbi:E3 ubiquitin ligase TRIM40 [Perognathus longimembris pacificus]|uniref:E3 ubiquitin ligase TRIM40 n=1 Tax=Perognathus longimembris pacificus TaxID=214514 RepID=UPI0020188AEB|nr:E3 ubiquitin ligase TRIM40 [Perognathus longimembris pacificus]